MTDPTEDHISNRFRITLHKTKVLSKHNGKPAMVNGVIIRIFDREDIEHGPVCMTCVDDMNSVHGLILGCVSERSGIPWQDLEDQIGIHDKVFFPELTTL